MSKERLIHRSRDVTDLFDVTLAQARQVIDDLILDHGEDARLDVDTRSYAYESSVYGAVYLRYQTPETPRERERRREREKLLLDQRREEYERLRREFESENQ